MTVAQLIRELEDLPQDERVVYEIQLFQVSYQEPPWERDVDFAMSEPQDEEGLLGNHVVLRAYCPKFG